MKIFTFIKDKALYLLINVIVIIIGYFFVQKGVTIEDVNRSGSAIYISIGTSLIATGIVLFLDLLRHLSIAELLKKVNNIINEAGVQWVYKKRDLDKYDDLMKELNNSLDIAGYSLGAFFDSYSELLKYKVKTDSIRVRMLLVNPNSIHSTSRAEAEGRNPDQFKDKIETLLKFFKGQKGIEIRYFDAPLSSMIFRIDKIMFVGPHFYKRQSKSTFTQELKNNHWLFSEYQTEFDRMWEDSNSVE